jgi:hypothetical protein
MSDFSATLTRRRLLQLAAAGTATGLAGSVFSFGMARGAGPDGPLSDKDRKLLFVFCATGGASIIDSFMPIVDSEVGDPALAATLNTFPEWMVEQRPGSNIRSVKVLTDGYAYYATPARPMGDLLMHHGEDVVVMAHEVSSVNHTVGQQRSLSGGGFDRGRTILESAAMRHGVGLPLPNCNMASDGYLRHGVDPSVPQEARHELITSPLLFAAGTHGFRGVVGAPRESAIERARSVREQLDQQSVFARTFKHDARLGRYLQGRREVVPRLEQASMIEKLLLLDPSKIDATFGLKPDPLIESLRGTLPNMDSDKAQAQLALGFLMAYHGVSSSIAMGFNSDPVVDQQGAISGAPIAFDFSHNLHRVVQSLMWCRTASMIDTLVTLLKTHDYLGDPALGKMWDRSLVYIATEFGRDKKRPSGSSSWGTGHNLNNGSVLISPLLKGNAVYGGVDPRTGSTYGFDPESGAPDKNRVFNESDVYSVIAQALELPVPAARAFPAVVRGS